MGGLVARYYLEVLEGWRDCRALLSFGTPYRGSVNILNFLANGYKQLFLDFTELVRSFTASYQLLPTYAMLATEGAGADQHVFDVSNIPGVDQQRALAARQFHQEMDDAVAAHRQTAVYFQEGYELLPAIGIYQPTFQSARLAGGKLTISTAAAQSMQGFDGLADGDGTVPHVSAIPLELSAWPRGVFAPEKHASLQNNDLLLGQLLERIKQLQQPDIAALRAPAPMLAAPAQMQSVPALALDIEDLYTAGEPITVRARLIHPQATPARVILSLASLNSASMQIVTLDEQDGEWTTTIDLPPGPYRVELSTGDSGPDAPSPIHDIFEVAP